MLDGARVLLVEDNAMNQQVAKELLEKAGVIVVIAEDGAQAVEMVRQAPYDLILMDIQMPKMDGITATGKIREMTGTVASLPIIAMTANAMVGDRQKSLDAGMNDHISKPVDPWKLYACMIRWLDGKPVSEAQLAAMEPEGGTGSNLAGRLQGLDVATTLNRLGGNLSLYGSLLQEFVDTYGDVADRIRQYVQDGDEEIAVRDAHTAKGLSATIGAKDLHQAFLNVELAMKEKGGSLEIALEALTERLETVLAVIYKALPLTGTDNEGEGASPAEMNADKLAGNLEKLLSLIHANDMASEALFNDIRHVLGERFPTQTQGIRDAIGRLDFKTAATLLEPIVNKLAE